MAASARPLVVLGCTPAYSHVQPIKAIAKALISRGYEITAVSSSHFQKIFEEIGCGYIAIEGYGDFYDGDFETKWPARNSLPLGPERFAHDMENTFVRSIPDQFAAIQKAIKMLKEKYPGRPVVQLNESMFMGSLPIIKGARGVKPDGTLAIGITAMALSSVDTAPYGPGLPPPSSAGEVAQYQAMGQQIQTMFFKKPREVFMEIVKELGVNIDDDDFSPDALYLWPDRFLQMCTPSAEYPRSDAPKSIRFTGGLPKGSKEGVSEEPAWWDEVVDNPLKKDIVFVCQGTVSPNYADTIIPTMEALRDRPNTLLIAALGVRGAKLDPSIPVPDNVRIADYLPFDDILAHSSVFVTNGGYGAFQHSISNGTPMVVAGSGEDKPEICARAEFAGVALNLRTGTPTSEALRAAVDAVASDPKYREAAQKLEAEMATFDPIGVVAANIEELAAGIKA
ncbi:UDP-glucosyltransferase A1 [Lachnellula suecica]|uniref:UDP-glucosyltransferase A1 n=1 Tax=Lachnellula suecica TaxID=602035 RepID=A0A8T9C610_9HELO|nr:UDP-glucosyltransferase A1 [Lachnellula suecica]